MLENLKPFYERMLRPALRFFQRAGIRPNQLTVAGAALFAVVGALCAFDHWYTAAAFVVVASFVDGWDGLLARETGQKTDFGAILDSTCDRLAEIAWLAGLTVFYLRHAEYGPGGVYLCYAAITGSLMVSYVKARCEGQGVACRGGLLQRPERIIVLGAFLLIGPGSMKIGLGLLAIVSYVTVIQRLAIGRAACERAESMQSGKRSDGVGDG